MPGNFSRRTLEALDHPQVEVVGIVNRSILPADDPVRVIPARTQSPVPGFGSGSALNAPRFLVRSLTNQAVRDALIATEPDLIVVSCFPLRLPEPLLAASQIGAINIHPSFLPRHRGPDPLFWTFHAGDVVAGVSIHHVTARFDDGPVLRQESTPISNGATLASLDAELADLGAGMLGSILNELPALPEGDAQSDATSTYESFPIATDLVITPDWTVGRASRFVDGVGHSHGPITFLAHDGNTIRFRELSRSARSVEIVLTDGSIRVESLASGARTLPFRL